MAVGFKNIWGFWDLLKRAFTEWNNHEAPRMGASLAFYTLMSLAPLVIVTVSVAAIAFGHSGAQAQIVDQFRQMVGNDGAQTVETVLKSSQDKKSGILANVIGLLTLLFGASGVFVELRSALNQLWDIPAKQTSGVMGLIKDRFLSFGMVLAIGFVLLVSLSISAAVAAAGKFFGDFGFLPAWLWELVNFIFSLAVVAGVFALVFRFVPDVRIPWHLALHGAVVTALLFTVGKTIVGLYLGKASVGSAYGAAGSLVVLVVWVYYSAQIFFFGAEYTRVAAGLEGPTGEQSIPNAPAVEPAR